MADPWTRDTRPVRRIECDPAAPVPADGWPVSVPAVAQLLADGLELAPGVTFLVGENGSGKSTLVEAVAEAFGLNAEGGTPYGRHRTRPSESPLGSWLQLVRGAGAPRWGFFLRAESMHGYYTYLEREAGGRAAYHEMSHGESFLELIAQHLDNPGLYCLDEPEAALSFTSVLALVGRLDALARSGAQVLCATHSPVLCALPGARILEVGAWGLRESRWEDLLLVEHYRSFLAAPPRYLRHVLDPD
ncbi:AAA family ATPase [Microlunatus lacustris]